MRALLSHTFRAWTLVCALTLLAFCMAFPATAADPAPAAPTAKPAAKPAAKAKAAKAKSTKKSKTAKATSAPIVILITEQEALSTFDSFTVEWMQKLAATEEFQRTQRVEVKQTPQGFAAEYITYMPQRSIWVKKTAYTDTPYTGILSYYERIMRCVGKTKEEALQGPFEQGELKPVSEIFRFTRGKWVY